MAGSMADVPTILDYLNEDCWRAVLKYVPVQDIIRTERTSRRWQGVVLTYLRSVRIGVYEHSYVSITSKHRYVHRLMLKPGPAHLTSFEGWISKLGSSVVSACCHRNVFWKFIRENCPNLEDIMYYTLREIFDEYGSFKCLRRVSFYCCNSLPVEYYFINRLMCINTIEELEIIISSRLTLQCLVNRQWKNLKSLILKNCRELRTRHLLEATCLGQLNSFELSRMRDINIYQEIHLSIDKMPKLERLRCFTPDTDDINSVRFFESVIRLRYLKELATNFPCTDEDLDAVTRHCQELIILKVYYCDGVTGRGVAALCHNAGARLTKLCLQETILSYSSVFLTDDDMVAIISSCPNLEALCLETRLSTPNATYARAAAARRALGVRSPLHLHVGFFNNDVVEHIRQYKEFECHPRGHACAKCKM